MLQAVSEDIFGIASPRPCQFVGAHHCIFNCNTYLFVSRKRSEGNKLVSQLDGAFQRGVCIYVEPLVGLVSNQVEWAGMVKHNIKSYHGDKYKYDDQSLLIKN